MQTQKQTAERKEWLDLIRAKGILWNIDDDGDDEITEEQQAENDAICFSVRGEQI